MKSCRLIFNLLVLSCVLHLVSCKRLDGETVVEGQVVDKQTGQPVACPYVGLFSQKSGSFGGFAHEKDFATKDNGKFSFSFEGNEDKSYKLMASTWNGYYTEWLDAPNLKQGRNNKRLKVPVQPPAWLGIKLIDEPPRDSIILDIAGFGPIQKTIQYPDDSLIVEYVTYANEAQTIYWRINKNDIVSQFSKQLFFNRLDTTLLEIKF